MSGKTFVNGEILYAEALNTINTEVNGSLQIKTANTKNCNEIVTKGYYYVTNSITNLPSNFSSNSGILEVLEDGSHMIQRVTEISGSGGTWTRGASKSGNTWTYSSWKSISSGGGAGGGSSSSGGVEVLDNTSGYCDDNFKNMIAKGKDCYIPEGTYLFKNWIELNKPGQTLRMDKNAKLIFDFQDQIKAKTERVTACIRISANNVTIEGGQIQHLDYHDKSASDRYKQKEQLVTAIIRVGYPSAAEYCTLRDINIKGNGDMKWGSNTAGVTDNKKSAGGPEGASEENGIYICEGSNECRIYGCKVEGVQRGIYVKERNAYVENVYISKNSSHGIVVLSNAKQTNLIHVHTYVHKGDGFLIQSGTNNIVNCISSSNNGSGFHLSADLASAKRTNNFSRCYSEHSLGSGGYYVEGKHWLTSFDYCSSLGDKNAFAFKKSGAEGRFIFNTCSDDKDYTKVKGAVNQSQSNIYIGAMFCRGSLYPLTSGVLIPTKR